MWPCCGLRTFDRISKNCISCGKSAPNMITSILNRKRFICSISSTISDQIWKIYITKMSKNLFTVCCKDVNYWFCETKCTLFSSVQNYAAPTYIWYGGYVKNDTVHGIHYENLVRECNKLMKESCLISCSSAWSKLNSWIHSKLRSGFNKHIPPSILQPPWDKLLRGC